MITLKQLVHLLKSDRQSSTDANNGGKPRIQFFVSIQAKAQFKRLAVHYGYTANIIVQRWFDFGQAPTV